MPQQKDFTHCKKLWLPENCIYIQLGDKATNKELVPEQKAVVYQFYREDHTKDRHFTPENDSARLVLDLLAQKKGDGVSFNCIKQNLMENFDIQNPQDAERYLNEFLNELNDNTLLNYNEDPTIPDHIKIEKEYKDRHKPEHASKGKIKHGGTIICCGYTVSRYRP